MEPRAGSGTRRRHRWTRPRFPASPRQRLPGRCCREDGTDSHTSGLNRSARLEVQADPTPPRPSEQAVSEPRRVRSRSVLSPRELVAPGARFLWRSAVGRTPRLPVGQCGAARPPLLRYLPGERRASRAKRLEMCVVGPEAAVATCRLPGENGRFESATPAPAVDEGRASSLTPPSLLLVAQRGSEPRRRARSCSSSATVAPCTPRCAREVQPRVMVSSSLTWPAWWGARGSR
jgi:hypothetical protein